MNYCLWLVATLDGLHGNRSFIERDWLFWLRSAERWWITWGSCLLYNTRWRRNMQWDQLTKTLFFKSKCLEDDHLSSFESPENSSRQFIHNIFENVWHVFVKMFKFHSVQVFLKMLFEFRIRRYLPCCAEELVQTSGLRKVTDADFKKSIRQSGGSNCGITQRNVTMQKYRKSLIYVQSRWVTCRFLWDVTQCPPTPSTLMMSCLCGRSFISSDGDSSSCRRTSYKKKKTAWQCSLLLASC